MLCLTTKWTAFSQPSLNTVQRWRNTTLLPVCRHCRHSPAKCARKYSDDRGEAQRSRGKYSTFVFKTLGGVARWCVDKFVSIKYIHDNIHRIGVFVQKETRDAEKAHCKTLVLEMHRLLTAAAQLSHSF
eukprot:PhM_4_TR5236/c2_g1_i2/m.760